MSSILIESFRRDKRITKNIFDEYFNYLKTLEREIPESAYKYAIAEWHYDINDHRCPHDSWIDSIVIEEVAGGQRNETRKTEIKLKCLGAYHDGTFIITYDNAVNYSIFNKSGNNSHGDWLLDEIMLSDTKKVIHEIIFSNDSRLYIECDNLCYQWLQNK